jgi:hypothetical protein
VHAGADRTITRGRFQVLTAVGKIGPVRGAERQTRVTPVTHGLLAELPGADKRYLEQRVFSADCSALRDDKAVPGSAPPRLGHGMGGPCPAPCQANRGQHRQRFGAHRPPRPRPLA